MAAILKWMFVLVLLFAVAGGGAAYWFYSRSDEMLRMAVLQQFRTMAPNLKIGIARTNYDVLGRVRIYGTTIGFPDDEIDQPSIEIPEIIATLSDFEGFDDYRIQKIDLIHPRIHLIRRPDGIWNVQNVAIQRSADSSMPEIEIEHASVLTEFQQIDRPSRKLRFQNFNISAHPADSKRLLIQVATLLEPAGPLTMEIEAAIDGSTWKCTSREPWHVPVDNGLVQLASDISPEVATQLAKVRNWIDDTRATQAVTRSVDPLKLNSQMQVTSRSNDLGLSFDCDLTFRIEKPEAGSIPTFSVLADIVKGEIHNDLLAFPISELAGKIYVDNRQIIVEDLRGSNGSAQIRFDSKIVPSTPMTASMKVRGINMNNDLKSRMPEQLRKIAVSLGLTGTCDMDATATLNGGKWQPVIDLRLVNGSVTHERFPVTVREVTGKLRLEKEIVTFSATGKYAGRPVEAYGTVTNPGPLHHADIVVKSNNLPSDDESLAACPPDVRKSIEALRLKGRCDVLLRITRQAGLQQKYEPDLKLRVYDGSMSFTGFPLIIDQLKGFVRWKGDLIEFNELSGIHDGAQLTGSGTYQRLPGPGRLDLAIDAKNASFDRSLELALPATLRQVWSNFQPKGNFDVKTKIAWIRGAPCVVILPSVTVRDCEVVMRSFPWSLQNLNGTFAYNVEPGRLEIEEFHAKHDDTYLSGHGDGYFTSLKPWELNFTQLDIDNLVPNGTFRNALPMGLQRVFDFLRPTGVFSFHGPVRFRELNLGGNSIAANWDLRTVLSGCALNVGKRIDEIYGVVQIKGEWDGTTTKFNGDLDLDSVSIFRQSSGRAYQISGVRGPISFNENRFVAGTEEAIPPRKIDNPDPMKRIRGQAIDGTLFLDAAVNLGSETEYRVFTELQRGRLESYAQQYLRGRSRLAGVMNGWLNVRGKGSDVDRMIGEGKLVIDQAALYDSPVFAQMFQILKLQRPDRTAFENASTNFTVSDGRFNLNSIELLGDTLSMRGRGYVRFDGAMQMDFGVRLRQWLPNNLNAINVTGTVTDPQIRSVPLPELDDAVRQFFEAFNPRRMTPRPGLFAPITGKGTDAQNR